MKTLHLLRHAKSSWSESDVPDHDRGLKKKGERQRARMSAHLAGSVPAPDLIHCSDARRTRETLPPFLEAWGVPPDAVVYTPDLYLADEASLLAYVQALPDEADSALLCGHNPGLTDLVNRLTPRDTYVKNVRPCGIATLELDVDHWKDAAPGAARLTLNLRPKQLETPDA